MPRSPLPAYAAVSGGDVPPDDAPAAAERRSRSFRCLRCDRLISALAARCRYCGEPTPGGIARRGGVFALLLGIPLAIGFYGIGTYLNGNGLGWLTDIHPIDKISCTSERAEKAAVAAFDEKPQIRDYHDVRLIALTNVRQLSRSPEGLHCLATGKFDDNKDRPVDYRMQLNDGEAVSLDIYVP